MPDPGTMILATVPDGLRVDHADEVIQIARSMLRDIAASDGPHVQIDRGILVIRAVNGTWRYQLADSWHDKDGPRMVTAELIERPGDGRSVVDQLLSDRTDLALMLDKAEDWAGEHGLVVPADATAVIEAAGRLRAELGIPR